MSLFDDALETCVMLDKRTEADGYGGYTTLYVDGAEFKAAVTFDTSMEARTAEKQGVTSLYTITTPKAVTLEYNDVFRRVSDGRVFRVTSDGRDKKTPDSASLDMRVVTAETFTLPG